MTSAPMLADGRSTGAWAAWPVATQASLAVISLGAAGLAAPAFGLTLPPAAATALAAGAVAVVAWPRGAGQLSVLVCVALLLLLRPAYAGYHLALVAARFACRHLALGSNSTPGADGRGQTAGAAPDDQHVDLRDHGDLPRALGHGLHADLRRNCKVIAPGGS